VAVISLGGIVTSRSIRIAGDEMDEAIAQHVKKTYNLAIGERTSEEIKIVIGTAYLPAVSEKFDIRGRDLITGLPKTVEITSEEVFKALSEPVSAILEAIKATLEITPPELAADLMDRGIFMAGGGSLLRGLDRLVSESTGMPVHLADEPLLAVAYGTGRVLENIDMLRKVLIAPRKISR